MTVLWDPIRCISVEATPEEIVRQKWISVMTQKLGYPKGLLAVEKDLASLAKGSFDPNRRIDLLCYTPSLEGLCPLILFECKAKATDVKGESQLLGYNEAIKAPFLCLLLGETAKTFWIRSKKIESVPFLPTYRELISKL